MSARALVPILLRPKALSFKNYLRELRRTKVLWFRDGIISGFGLAIVVGLFYGGLWVLAHAQVNPKVVYFHPSIVLGLIFLLLFCVLTFSNLAAAFSSLYLAQDLELVLSSPLSGARFFWSKFLDIGLSSSWITFIFLFPALFSFGSFYHASIGFYFVVVVTMLAFFAIPTAASIVLVTLFARWIPANRGRQTMAIFVVALLLLLYFFASLVVSGDAAFSFQSLDDILRLVAILSIPNTNWMPSYWASTCIAEFLVPTRSTFLPYGMLLMSVAAAGIALAYLCVRIYHFAAYAKAFSSSRHRSSNAQASRQWYFWPLRWVTPPCRALVVKEFRVFTRDVSEMVQLLLLGGLCFVYFYNFRLLHALEVQLPLESRKWWELLIFSINTSVEAFLVAAIGTRFVFQSISLEGRSFWILQSAPITMKQVLRAKFYCWFIPIALVMSVLVGAGVYVVHGSLLLFILKVFSSVVISYGIVGLGIGAGAYFANFSWDQTYQLAASFGSLVYMFLSVGLIALDVSCAGVVVYANQLRGIQYTETQYALCVIATGCVLTALNYSVSRIALHLGEVALDRQLNK